MAIYVITGKPRHGKTYYMSTLVVKMLKQKRRIFSNIKLNFGVGALKKFSEDLVGDWSEKLDRSNPNKQVFYWSNIHEWEHFENGVILVDEAQRYFNARQWLMLSQDTEMKLQQHGKDNLDVWATTQHYSRIDITLRYLVEKFYIVKTILGKPNNKKPFLGLKRFRIVELDLEDIEDYYDLLKKEKFYKEHPDLEPTLEVVKTFRWFRKKYAIIYDTYAKVKESLAMPLVHKTRSCPECGKELITHV